MTATKVPISSVDPNPFQSRKKSGESMSKESISQLSHSLEAIRLVETVLPARKVGRRYQLVWGHRRLAAFKQSKKAHILLEVREITDDEMKIGLAVENFNRQGLTDEEKVNAFRAAEKALPQTQTNSQVTTGRSTRMSQLRELLGLKEHTFRQIQKLSEISKGNRKVQTAVASKRASAAQVSRAHRLGGDAMVDTAINKSLSSGQINKISSAISKVEETHGKRVAARIKKEIISGKVTTPEKVASRARYIAKEKSKRAKKAPPDLATVLDGWAADVHEWVGRIKEVTPYGRYVRESNAATARRFLGAVDKLRNALAGLEKTLSR